MPFLALLKSFIVTPLCLNRWLVQPLLSAITMTTPANEAVTREKLIEDVRTVITDCEVLLRTTTDATSKVARERIEESLRVARQRLASMEETARASARATNEYVKEHPWHAVGIGALAGAIVGVLIGRR